MDVRGHHMYRKKLFKSCWTLRHIQKSWKSERTRRCYSFAKVFTIGKVSYKAKYCLLIVCRRVPWYRSNTIFVILISMLFANKNNSLILVIIGIRYHVQRYIILSNLSFTQRIFNPPGLCVIHDITGNCVYTKLTVDQEKDSFYKYYFV